MFFRVRKKIEELDRLKGQRIDVECLQRKFKCLLEYLNLEMDAHYVRPSEGHDEYTIRKVKKLKGNK